MVAESTRVTQVEDPMASIGAEDNAVQTSAGEPSDVEFVAAPVAVEAITTTVPEVLATTSASQEPVVGLISAQVELAPVSVDTTRTIIERGSRSASTRLSPATDIIKELTHQMVQQFFASMNSCIEFFPSGEVPSSLLGCFLRIRSRTSVTLEAWSKLRHI